MQRGQIGIVLQSAADRRLLIVCVAQLLLVVVRPVIAQDVQCPTEGSISITATATMTTCYKDTEPIPVGAYFSMVIRAADELDTLPAITPAVDGEQPGCTATYGDRRKDGPESIQVAVSVTCMGRYSPGPHSVTVVAIYDRQPGCPVVTASAAATITVSEKPVMELWPSDPAELCYGTTGFTSRFLFLKRERLAGRQVYYSTVLDGDPDGKLSCTVQDGNQGSVDVTCRTVDNTHIPVGSFGLTLTAIVPAEPGTVCMDEPIMASAHTVATISSPPSIELNPGVIRPVCVGTHNASVTFDYKLNYGQQNPVVVDSTAVGQVVGTDVVTPAEVQCTTAVTGLSQTSGQLVANCMGDFSSALTELQVTASLTTQCQTRQSAFTWSKLAQHTGNQTFAAAVASVSVKVMSPTATVGLTPAGRVTVFASSAQPFACCLVKASSYATTRAKAGVGQTFCYKHARPGPLSGPCTPMQYGYYNRGELQDGVMRVPRARKGKLPDCKTLSGTGVGLISATCSGRRRMLINILSYATDTISRRLYYFGCRPPVANRCPGSRWKLIPDTPIEYNSTFDITQFDVITPPGCDCQSTYWAVYEKESTYRTVAASNCQL